MANKAVEYLFHKFFHQHLSVVSPPLVPGSLLQKFWSYKNDRDTVTALTWLSTTILTLLLCFYFQRGFLHFSDYSVPPGYVDHSHWQSYSHKIILGHRSMYPSWSLNRNVHPAAIAACWSDIYCCTMNNHNTSLDYSNTQDFSSGVYKVKLIWLYSAEAQPQVGT